MANETPEQVKIIQESLTKLIAAQADGDNWWNNGSSLNIDAIIPRMIKYLGLQLGRGSYDEKWVLVSRALAIYQASPIPTELLLNKQGSIESESE